MSTKRFFRFPWILIVLVAVVGAGCSANMPRVYGHPTMSTPNLALFVESPKYYQEFKEIDGKIAPIGQTNGDEEFARFLFATFREEFKKAGLATIDSEFTGSLRVEINLVHWPWLPLVHQKEEYLIRVYEGSRLLVNYFSLFRYAIVGPWRWDGMVGKWSTKREIEAVVRLIVDELLQKKTAVR